jgi:hypothetical protein
MNASGLTTYYAETCWISNQVIEAEKILQAKIIISRFFVDIVKYPSYYTENFRINTLFGMDI